jgi:hypothetical protein
MLLSFWGYLYSLKLILDGPKIKYNVLWYRYEGSIDNVISITRNKRGYLRLGIIWLMKRRDSPGGLSMNLSNFMPGDIKRFVRSLAERAPGIKFHGLGALGP